MDTKLTYKLKEIISKNEYTNIVTTNKETKEESKITDANIRFRYEPKLDKAYLCFGNETYCTICEVEDSSINEVIINSDSITVETDFQTFYCTANTEKVYY